MIHTFSMTLHTYCHHKMRKMITTSKRMMVTRQPIRTDVLLSSGKRGFDVTVLTSARHPNNSAEFVSCREFGTCVFINTIHLDTAYL